MTTVRRIPLTHALKELSDISGAVIKPVLLLLMLVVLDVALLWSARAERDVRRACEDVLAWLFGSGVLPGSVSALELLCLCIAGFLGYLLLGLVVWVVVRALTNAYSDNGEGGSVNMKKVVGIVCVLMVVFLVLIGIRAMREPGDTDTAVSLSEFRAVELPISYSAVTHLAQSRGFVENAGLSYRVLSVPAGPDLINALRVKGTGRVDVGSIATTPVAVMIGAGDHPVVLATAITSPEQVQLVAFESSGITADPLTLRGKRIGFVGSTVGEIYLSRLLAKAALTENDIKAVNGRPADLKALLLRGDLDAAVLWDPFIAQVMREASLAEHKQSPKVFVEPGLYNLSFYIVAMAESIQDRREDLIRFLRACVSAGDAISADRMAAQKELERWLNLQEGDLDHFMETTSFRVHLDSEQVASDLRAELQWLQKRQPTAGIPESLEHYIDASLLEEVDASRIVHR